MRDVNHERIRPTETGLVLPSLSENDEAEVHTPCRVCGFDLWLPISTFGESHLGLYSDWRFPGRCILSLDQHFEQIDEVPGDTQRSFMQDMARAVSAIKAATGSPRVNVAILGNAEGHVHAHLIPRYPDREQKPHKAPWEDARERGALEKAEQTQMVEAIRQQLHVLRPLSSRPIRRSKTINSAIDNSVPLFALQGTHEDIDDIWLG